MTIGFQLLCLISIIIILNAGAASTLQMIELDHVLIRSAVSEGDAQRTLELIQALKYVVERHLHLESDTVCFQLQWSTEYGKRLLMDMVEEVVPLINEHAIAISTSDSNCASGREAHFVWLFDTLESFVKLDAQLKDHSSNNRNLGDGVFLVVYVLPSEEKEIAPISEGVLRILRSFHELSLLGVNVMLNDHHKEEGKQGGVLFYSYLPFQAGQCGLLKPKLINIFRNGKLKYPNVFERTKVNFQRCPFRVMALAVEPFITIASGSGMLTGFEGEVVHTIADKLNASLKLLPQPREPSSVHADGEATGFFRQLRNNEGDFIVGLQFLSVVKVKYFKPSVSYYTTRQILVVRKGNAVMSNSKWLTLPFTKKTWLYVGLCCAFLIPFGIVTQHAFSIAASDPNRTVSSYRYVVLNVIAMILGISQSLTPTRTVYRMTFATTSLALLVLRSVYQGKIYDDYSSAQMDDTPNNLEELIRHNYSILTTYAFDVPEILLDNVKNDSGIAGLQVIRNELLPQQNFELLEQNQNHHGSRSAAITTSYDYYNYYIKKYNKKGIFKVLKQHLVSLKGCFYFRGNSYIQKEIDSIINRLEPSGILKAWISRNMERPLGDSQTASNTINMDKLQMVTLWYGFSCVLAAAIFLCEILLAQYWRLRTVPHISILKKFQLRRDPQRNLR